ncbi:MAG: sugar-binding protein [Myxococcota bacterium]
MIENNVVANNARRFIIHPNTSTYRVSVSSGMSLWGGWDNVIRNNVFYGNGQYGILMRGSGNLVANNTFYGNGRVMSQPDVWDNYPSSCIGCSNRFHNNLGAPRNGGGMSLHPDSTASHNLFSDAPGFLAPGIGDFRLTGSSPAINAGIVLEEVSEDFTGALRTVVGGYDLGAFEFGAAPHPDSNPTVPQNPPTKSVSALRADTLVTVDGVLNECIWNTAEQQSFFNAARSDNKVVFSVLWDTEAVYIGADVADTSFEADGEKLYQDDGLELFLHANRGDQASRVLHFKVNILGEAEGGVLSGASSETSTGYTMEVRVPWTTLGVSPSEGTRLGFLLGNNDRDQGASSQFDWLDLIEIPGVIFARSFMGNLF